MKKRSKLVYKKRDSELTPHEDEYKLKALDVVALTRREKYSLHKASKKVRISPKTVRRYTNAYVKRGGRWVPKRFDRVPRSMFIYERGIKGRVIVEFRDSRTATLIGEYWNIIDEYLQSGNKTVLKTLRRTSFKDIDGKTRHLETNPGRIYEIALRESEREFYEIYHMRN